MERQIDMEIKQLYLLISEDRLDEATTLEKSINEKYSLKEREANKEIFLFLQYKRDKQSIRETVDKIIALPMSH